MEAKYDRCCGIDVHKKLLVACVRCGDQSEIRKFATTTSDIRKMIGWIADSQCQMTVMESTGSYWIPVWNVFEDGCTRNAGERAESEGSTGKEDRPC